MMLCRIIRAQRMRQILVNPPGFSSKQELHTGRAVGGMQKGDVHSRAPTTLRMEKGKTYNWCACGLSKNQPLCDGSHKDHPRGLKPITFSPDSTKDYTLCNCKQTDQRPFCDGSHKK